jgi:hypothetical protein
MPKTLSRTRGLFIQHNCTKEEDEGKGHIAPCSRLGLDVLKTEERGHEGGAWWFFFQRAGSIKAR